MTAPPDRFANDPWLAEKPRRVWRIPKWLVVSLVGCAVMMGMLITGLIALGVAIQSGHIPDSKALSTKELPAATLDWLRAKGLVGSDETVHYFYADGMFDLAASGSLVTDRRVIHYATNDSEAGWEVFEAPLGEVIDIETTFAESWGESTEIHVETADLREAQLVVGTEDHGDKSFDRVLRDTWRAERARVVPGLNTDGSMPLDRQLEVLAEFGIALRPGCTTSGWVEPFDLRRCEQEPFDLLLRALADRENACGSDRPSGDVSLLEYESLEDPHDYTRYISCLRELADGALDVRSLVSAPDAEDDDESDADSFDVLILARADAQLEEGESGRRFACAELDAEVQALVVCIEADRLIEFRRRTGVAFHWVE